MPTKDPEKKRQQRARWLAKNPGYHAQWRATNPEKNAGYAESARARALPAMLADTADPRHGTLTGYTYGCRCDQCRTAKAHYSRAQAMERKRLRDLGRNAAADAETTSRDFRDFRDEVTP